jgi:excisionase family DNA binding protein
MASLDELLTAAQVAEWLNVTQQTVRRWAENGTVPAVRIGPRAIRFRRSDIDALVAEYHAQTGQAV